MRARRVASGLGLVVLGVAAAYISTLSLGGAATGSTAAGAGLHVIGSPVVGVRVGELAPDFIGADDGNEPLLVDLDGTRVRLADFAGKPLWIVFWATWCIPCQHEASTIRDLYHAHRGADLAVLAIDIQEPAAAVREYALTHELDYRIGLDPRAAVKSLYGALGLPSHFFLDGYGVIRARYFGEMTRDLMEESLRAIIAS